MGIMLTAPPLERESRCRSALSARATQAVRLRYCFAWSSTPTGWIQQWCPHLRSSIYPATWEILNWLSPLNPQAIMWTCTPQIFHLIAALFCSIPWIPTKCRQTSTARTSYTTSTAIFELAIWTTIWRWGTQTSVCSFLQCKLKIHTALLPR